jgi:hypothetical protein
MAPYLNTWASWINECGTPCAIMNPRVFDASKLNLIYDNTANKAGEYLVVDLRGVQWGSSNNLALENKYIFIVDRYSHNGNANFPFTTSSGAIIALFQSNIEGLSIGENECNCILYSNAEILGLKSENSVINGLVYTADETELRLESGSSTYTINGNKTLVTEAMDSKIISDKIKEDCGFAILKHPISQSAKIGEVANFKIELSTSCEDFDYRWLRNATPLESAREWQRNGREHTLIVPVSNIMQNGDEYSVEVKHPMGNYVTSNIAVLSVIEADMGVKIIKQPESQLIYAGKSISINIEAISDSPIQYQWVKGIAQVPIPNETGSSIVISSVPIEEDGSVYAVLVSDANGNKVISQSFYLRVLDPNKPTSELITLKGELLNRDGLPLAQNSIMQKDMVVRLFDSAKGGKAVYTEWFLNQYKQPVDIYKGRFTLQLGMGFSVQNLRGVLKKHPNLYAEFGIGGLEFQERIQPRLALTSIPYSFNTGKILSGEGKPNNRVNIAPIGSWYVDSLTNKTYQKIDGAWKEIH